MYQLALEGTGVALPAKPRPNPRSLPGRQNHAARRVHRIVDSSSLRAASLVRVLREQAAHQEDGKFRTSELELWWAAFRDAVLGSCRTAAAHREDRAAHRAWLLGPDSLAFLALFELDPGWVRRLLQAAWAALDSGGR